jgi:adenosylmethionine-8-amino-7-oxononanoate aminotransferase
MRSPPDAAGPAPCPAPWTSRTLDLGIEPDLLVLGKNLTSGYVPVAALMVSAALYELAANPDPPRFLPRSASSEDSGPVVITAAAADSASSSLIRAVGWAGSSGR